MQQEQEEYGSLLRELGQLKAENTRLKDLLLANGIAYEAILVDSGKERVYSKFAA